MKLIKLTLICLIFSSCLNSNNSNNTGDDNNGGASGDIEAIHHWTFDTNLNDSGTTGGWNGSSNGTAGVNPSGARVGSGSLYVTGGVGNNIQIGVKSLPSEITVAYWVKPVNWGGRSAIISSADNNNLNGIDFSIFGFGPVALGAYYGSAEFSEGSSSAYDSTMTSSDVIDADWTHIIVSWSDTSKEVNVYINGSLSKTETLDSLSVDYDSGNLMIGESNGSYSFTGYIDDLILHEGIISEAQAEELFNSYTVF